MAKQLTWLWKAIVPLMLGALILVLAWSRWPLGSSFHAGKKGASERTTPVSTASWPLAGTASCSARGCHGAIEPVLNPARCQQNEYNLWAHDRHADAYRALFNERSKDIARILGGAKKAHEDPRCLACHTNPRLAVLPEETPFVQQERLFGVGCESCHGSANSWLVAHTAADRRVKKRAYEMPDLTEPALRAKTCAGCHVGAAPDKEAPLRDVNHDLIAAGHPRLNFEFGTYQANMPPHWRVRKMAEGHFWAVGQIVSAQAALELLSHRAKCGPWPEFAEYDCFACHHSLGPITRNRGLTPLGSPIGSPSRKPGELAWGSWYFALTDSLGGESAELKSLRTVMQKLNPDRKQAAGSAQAALLKLKSFHAQFAGAKKDVDDLPLDRRRLLALVKESRADAGWDGAEQVYLALNALNQSQADPGVAAVLQELTPMRAFPPGFAGPISWTRNGQTGFDPSEFFARLRRFR
jgi:Cytochrome c554 and c-prime